MYTVWFCDLEKAIKAFRKAYPNFETFTSIHGNAYGDFVIKYDDDLYIVKHSDFSVWHLEGAGWKASKWVEVS